MKSSKQVEYSRVGPHLHENHGSATSLHSSFYKPHIEKLTERKSTMRVFEELDKALLNSKYGIIPLSQSKLTGPVVKICSYGNIMATFSTKQRIYNIHRNSNELLSLITLVHFIVNLL